MNKLILLFLLSFSTQGIGSTPTISRETKSSQKYVLDKEQIEVLNQLKDEINNYYGLHEGSPRINSGPCGRFANLFYQKWNERFIEKVSISFIMSPDSSECYHVLVKLPDNRYYDGGSGIMKKKKMLKGYGKGTYIIDMMEYDFKILDEMSYGLEREYDLCPNYSDLKTSEIIEKNLMRITRGLINPI